MGSQTIRVPITVKFISNKTGKMTWSASSTIKSKIRNMTSDALAQNGSLEDSTIEVTVMYSRKQDSWNKFNFETIEEFDEKIAPVLELDLLRELRGSGMMERKYLA